jgi:hypothetical protein
MNELTTLPQLAQRINAEHEAAGASFKAGLLHARAAGELLLDAKAQVPHGEWLPWLAANAHFSEVTAQRYMRVAARRPGREEGRMATTVVNVNAAAYGTFIYVGRGGWWRGRRRLPRSTWGNPFVPGKDGTRAEVVAKFARWLATGDACGCPKATAAGRAWVLAHLPELRGQVLGCHCKPKACHGDVLAELADAIK